MTVGKRLKELRLKKGYTQQYVADVLGIGRSNLGHIENDRVSLESKHAQTLAELYDTSYDYIYTGEGEEHIDPDIRTLRRAAKDMTPEQRKKAIKILEATFEDLFDDED
ncbi:helix-turn-helix domain-containing protein [Gracilibacillus lacisalsi]|uniref:helix-turn-helix domain-containing protein n=1 Tax=Gracilibacillus lacisalsi TaxID=393087 RepID=UPI00037333F1|nr:helix-turn-helix transcriptional regulator [Gracilibacillus lacisalsi]